MEAFLVSTGFVALAEIGDKTQIANGPVVLLGHRIAERLPVSAIRWVTMALFAALGVVALAGP